MIPRPPNRLVPPMTTAVMLSRLASLAAFGLAAPTRPIRIQAVIPKIKPATRYADRRIRLTGMPASRAASRSSPTA